VSQSQPFFQHINFAEDVSAGYFHGQAAQQKHSRIQEEDGRQKYRTPVTDLFMGSRIHVCTGLASEKQRHQDCEKHHVGREN
jgi:hypothetical protein